MNYIESEAKALAAKYGTNDPFEIARAEGISIYYRDDFTKLKGMYKVILRRRCVFINAGLPEEEMRYICAHELGHDRLHRAATAKAGLCDFVLFDVKNKLEYEANLFAANLLIDDREVSHAAVNGLTAAELAASLGVPENLITIKAANYEKRRQFHPPRELKNAY